MPRKSEKISPRTDVREVPAGEHLRAEIQRLGFDQVELAQALGVTRQTINNIINGRYPISRAIAGKLGRLTERRADYWLQSSFFLAAEPEAIPMPSKREHVPEPENVALMPSKGESFRSFVRRLARADAPEELVQRIGADKAFPDVKNWGQLRVAVRTLDNSDDTFVAARRLWRQYTTG